MEVLGEDQRANLAALLRQGAPQTPIYAPAQTGDLKSMKKLHDAGSKLYEGLQAQGDGSAWEGLKSTLGMGTPDLAGQNYNAEFGKYDPQFQATMAQNPNAAPNTAPVAPVDPNAQGGMFGGMGNTMSGWFK